MATVWVLKFFSFVFLNLKTFLDIHLDHFQGGIKKMLESGDAPESQQIKAIRCCAYKDCNIQIEFPMWGKYCKSHRQKVYKKNYQKKKCKLKEKYKVTFY